jgi:hypothetical protein
MRAKDVVKSVLATTRDTMKMYLGDLTDADMTVRPVPSANHIAWQLAHLIAGEKHLLEGELPGAVYPPLPPAIAELGNERTGKVDPAAGYLPKTQYLEWFDKLRGVTLAAVDKLADSDLDTPTKGPMAKYAPTLGDLLVMTANHTLMHAGQFTVVRRALGKPVVM